MGRHGWTQQGDCLQKSMQLHGGAKNKFATQGRFNKTKVKKHKKVTPYPSEMLKLLDVDHPHPKMFN